MWVCICSCMYVVCMSKHDYSKYKNKQNTLLVNVHFGVGSRLQEYSYQFMRKLVLSRV